MFKQRGSVQANTNTGVQTKVAHSKTLARYVKKNAFFSILMAVLALWLLQLIFSYLAQLEEVTDSYTYLDALQYILYRSPYFLEQFIPTGALLGAVIGLGLLANNSEIVVMRAAGVSIYRIVAWVLQPALLFVFIALGINQFVLPQSNLLASQIRDADTPLLSSVDGYWTLRNLKGSQSEEETPATGDIGNTDKTISEIIFIDYADANGNIGEVKRWRIEENYTIVSASKALGGHYIESTTHDDKRFDGIDKIDGIKPAPLDNDLLDNDLLDNDSSKQTTSYQWQLKSLSEVHITQDIDQAVATRTPLLVQTTQTEAVMTLPIAPSSIFLLTRRAEDLSLTELYEHYKFNQAQGRQSLEHELAFWQKLLSPFAIISLVIIACSFVFGSLRTYSLGLRIVVSLLFGLLFSYMQDLTGFVALATGVPPLLMVALPIVISAIFGLVLLKRQM